MNYDEGQILSDALSNMPCEVVLRTYNDAVSLQAQLNKYIRETKKIYERLPGKSNPFENLDIKLIKPATLRFAPLVTLKMRPISDPLLHPDLIELNLIESPKDSTPGDKP